MNFQFPLNKKDKGKEKEKDKNKKNSKVEIIESGYIEGEAIRDIIINNLAGIKAFNTFISLADILQDNNNRLIVIDTNRNLKIFKGNVIQEESTLSIYPSGLVSYYSEDPISKSIVPFFAIAGGNYIFIYKNLKGTIKYNIPDQEINSEEKIIYQQYNNGSIDEKKCLKKIFDLADRLSELNFNVDDADENNNNDKKDDDNEDNNDNDENNEEKEKYTLYKNEPLSQFSLELLSLPNQKLQYKFLEDNKNTKILIRNYITCINSIYRDNSSDIKSLSYLVIGTENSLIYIIDQLNKEPIAKIRIFEVPFLIQCKGHYRGEHKIYVSGRGCTIYIIHKDSISNKFIVPQPIVNFFVSSNNIYIGTISKNYISYSLSGAKVFCIHQPDYITAMEYYHRLSEGLDIIFIALKNNEIRLYNEKKILKIFNFNENIFGMKFGKFETRNDCLVLFTYSGSLIIRSFREKNKFANFSIDNEKKEEEEGKITIPKKNLLFLNLQEREKEQCVNMQNIFQNDLIRLRYKAMDTYVKMLKIGNAPQNYSSSSTMKMSVSLEGLGPNFKLNLILDNSGNEPLFNGILSLDFNRKIYYFEKESIILSIIMPHIPVKYSLNFKNVSENGNSGMIKIIIVDKFQNSPLIQYTIKVPVSELEML